MATEVIGHRGAAHYAPENTVVSVMTALFMGADGVEIDVRMTLDNRVVVIHDPDTLRTTGHELKVAESSYEEISRLEAGNSRDKKFAGEKIPLFDDLACAVSRGKKFFVEVKCGPEALPQIIETIRKLKKEEDTFIISFSLEVVAAAKQIAPEIGALLIVDKFDHVLSKEQLLKIVIQNSLDGLDTDYKIAGKDLIDAVHAAGKKIYVWTVDSAEEAVKLAKNGIDGIASNKPDVIIRAVSGL